MTYYTRAKGQVSQNARIQGIRDARDLPMKTVYDLVQDPFLMLDALEGLSLWQKHSTKVDAVFAHVDKEDYDQLTEAEYSTLVAYWVESYPAVVLDECKSIIKRIESSYK